MFKIYKKNRFFLGKTMKIQRIPNSALNSGPSFFGNFNGNSLAENFTKKDKDRTLKH